MDAAVKKTVLRMVSYGLYAVTAKHNDERSVMTVNWLTQTSFEPPLVALAVQSTSHSRQVIEASGALAVNIFESGQGELAGLLAQKHAKNPAKFDQRPWQPGPVTGSPVLDEVLGWFECKVLNHQPSGDHTLFLVEVVNVGLNREGTPLTLKEAGFKYAG